MRFIEKVWEVWDLGKKYDLLPKVWDVEGLHQGGLNEKDNDNNQIIKCLTFLESQAQVHFNDDNGEEEHKNEN